MPLNDDQQRVRRIMTAVLAGDFNLATSEVRTAPNPVMLAETTFMLMLPIIQVIAGMNGVSPEEWWRGFMLHIEENPA